MISIAMPTFMHHTYIREAINSILSQSHKDFELIIVPVIGDEETISIIKSITDSRIRIIMSNYACITHQMNIGALAAKGEYFIYFASDDILMKNSLSNIYKFSKKNNLSVAYPGYHIVNKHKVKKGKIIPPSHSHKLLMKGCYITDISLVKTEDFKKFLPMKFSDGKYRIYNVWKEMSESGSFNIKRYPSPFYLYRQHGKNIHNKKFKSQRNFTYVVVGTNANIEDFYKDISSRKISKIDRDCFTVYFPNPLKYLKHIGLFEFKRVILHWDKEYISNIDKFIGFETVHHITHDADVLSIIKEKGMNNVVFINDKVDLLNYLKEERYQ